MTPDSSGPGTDCIEYTSFAGDVDLYGAKGRTARMIRVVTAGAGTKKLDVITAGSKGASRSLTCVDGQELVLQVTKILATSTVTLVQVTW